MKEPIKFIFIAGLLLILQITIFNDFKVFGIKPDLLLILTIFFSLYGGAIFGLSAGISAGFLKDVFSVSSLGINTFSFAIIGISFAVFKNRLFRESIFTQFILIITSCLLMAIVYNLASSSGLDYPAPIFLKTCFLISIYTSIWCPFVFFFLRRIFFVKKF